MCAAASRMRLLIDLAGTCYSTFILFWGSCACQISQIRAAPKARGVQHQRCRRGLWCGLRPAVFVWAGRSVVHPGRSCQSRLIYKSTYWQKAILLSMVVRIRRWRRPLERALCGLHPGLQFPVTAVPKSHEAIGPAAHLTSPTDPCPHRASLRVRHGRWHR